MRITDAYSHYYTQNIYKDMASKTQEANAQVAGRLKIQDSYQNAALFADGLRLDYEIATFTQVVESSKKAIDITKNSDNALMDMTKAMDQFKNKLVHAANQVHSKTSLNALANDLQAIRTHIMHIANTSINGQFLFSGTAVGTKPFDEKGDYFGNDEPMNVVLGSRVHKPYNVPGSELFISRDNDYSKIVTTNVRMADNSKDIKAPEDLRYLNGEDEVKKLIGRFYIKEGNIDDAKKGLDHLQDYSENEPYSMPDTHFYIRGTKPNGQNFSAKFSMKAIEKIDALLEKIGTAFGNTAKNRVVEVSLSASGTIEVKDLKPGSERLSFNMLAATQRAEEKADLLPLKTRLAKELMQLHKEHELNIPDIASDQITEKNILSLVKQPNESDNDVADRILTIRMQKALIPELVMVDERTPMGLPNLTGAEGDNFTRGIYNRVDKVLEDHYEKFLRPDLTPEKAKDAKEQLATQIKSEGIRTAINAAMEAARVAAGGPALVPAPAGGLPAAGATYPVLGRAGKLQFEAAMKTAVTNRIDAAITLAFAANDNNHPTNFSVADALSLAELKARESTGEIKITRFTNTGAEDIFSKKDGIEYERIELEKDKNYLRSDIAHLRGDGSKANDATRLKDGLVNVDLNDQRQSRILGLEISSKSGNSYEVRVDVSSQRVSYIKNKPQMLAHIKRLADAEITRRENEELGAGRPGPVTEAQKEEIRTRIKERVERERTTTFPITHLEFDGVENLSMQTKAEDISYRQLGDLVAMFATDNVPGKVITMGMVGAGGMGGAGDGAGAAGATFRDPFELVIGEKMQAKLDAEIKSEWQRQNPGAELPAELPTPTDEQIRAYSHLNAEDQQELQTLLSKAKNQVHAGLDKYGKFYVQDIHETSTDIKLAMYDMDAGANDEFSFGFKPAPEGGAPLPDREMVWEARQIREGSKDASFMRFATNSALIIDEPNVDILKDLQKMIDAVRKGDVRANDDEASFLKNPGIQAALKRIDHLQDHVRKIHTKIGATQTAIDSASQRASSMIINVTKVKSELIDVDVPEASLNLQALALAFQASMQASVKVMNLNLLSYMR